MGSRGTGLCFGIEGPLLDWLSYVGESGKCRLSSRFVFGLLVGG